MYVEDPNNKKCRDGTCATESHEKAHNFLNEELDNVSEQDRAEIEFFVDSLYKESNFIEAFKKKLKFLLHHFSQSNYEDVEIVYFLETLYEKAPPVSQCYTEHKREEDFSLAVFLLANLSSNGESEDKTDLLEDLYPFAYLKG